MPHDFKLLEGIVAFVEVVNCGSFTRAAEQSGHSTSFISKQISKLEERLGVRLLNRTTRSLSLTPEGTIYFKQSQQLVLDAELAVDAVGGKQQVPKGVLKISCAVSFGLSRLRPVLSQFTSRYPEVDIELELNDRKIDMVAEGFDLLIRGTASKVEDSSLIYRRFLRAHNLVIAAPSYLEKYGEPKHPEELSHHRTISYSNSPQPMVWSFIGLDGEEMQVKVKSQVLTNSSQMEVALCAAGQGITRMPSFNIGNELKNGEIVEILTKYPPQSVDMHLVYSSKRHMSLKLRCFIEFILESLGNETDKDELS